MLGDTAEFLALQSLVPKDGVIHPGFLQSFPMCFSWPNQIHTFAALQAAISFKGSRPTTWVRHQHCCSLYKAIMASRQAIPFRQQLHMHTR